ncbi:MAG: DUF4982 domain-containing protein [Bacteroides sp.]|jgi:hypothetical protein|nr:DUF4982 domain-containing protein [Bacteroides sp.]
MHGIDFKYGIICFMLSLCLGGCQGLKKLPDRKQCLDEGWYFCLEGDTISSPSSTDWSWRRVDLPHDWSIETLSGQARGVTCGPFTRRSAGGKSTGYTAGGTGWYARTFVIPEEEADQLHFLYFEGAYMETEVWVNGKKLGYHPNGYTSFIYDISSCCLPAGQVNTVVVRVVNKGKNSRWYSGSGLYRHVWMVVADPLHLKHWGNSVYTSAVRHDSARIQVSSTLCNRYQEDRNVVWSVSILSPGGDEVASFTRGTKVLSGKKQEISETLFVEHPQLWSVSTPVLYKAVFNMVSDRGKLLDRKEIPFGVRTLAYDATRGFLLNGKPLLLKGGCIHHDNGFLGAAAIDRAEVRKVELLKSNGFNAVRCAHNPPSEAFLNACDTLGLLVIDEAFDQWRKPKNTEDYHRFFDRYAAQDVASMVLRDRNHPSICMWSIGNEIQERSDSSGICIARHLKEVVRRYDKTRPVTAAVNDYWDNPRLSWSQDSKRAFSTLDVCGYNYMGYEYESDHNRFPKRVMFGSESVAGESATYWDMVEKYPYVIGDFVWTALDYLGEAGIGHALELKEKEENPQFMAWPWFNAWCGDIDLCGDKKPQSYYRDVVWNRSPIAVCVRPPVEKGKVEKVSYWGWTDEYPSWCWNSFPNQKMTVHVYSRADSVRLYLNNRLMGEKQVGGQKEFTSTFEVEYIPGILKAVNVVKGRETESCVLTTPGEAYSLCLVADRTRLSADRNDLAYVHILLVDRKGNVISDSQAKIKLSVSGAGTLAGSGNASPTDMESFRSDTPRLYRGRALAILRSSGKPGEIRLVVTSPGIRQAALKIEVNKK